MNITVIPIPCGVTLTWDSDVSCQLEDDDPRLDSNISDGPCIRVCENSIINFTLNGNFVAIDHTDWNVTGGTVLNSTNTTCQIQWHEAPFYALQGTIFFIDGTYQSINRCIEKLNAPIALFGIMPNLEAHEITVCKDSDIIFEI